MGLTTDLFVYSASVVITNEANKENSNRFIMLQVSVYPNEKLFSHMVYKLKLPLIAQDGLCCNDLECGL